MRIASPTIASPLPQRPATSAAPRPKAKCDHYTPNHVEHGAGTVAGAAGGAACWYLALPLLIAQPARWMVLAAAGAGALIFGTLGWFAANHDEHAGGAAAMVGGIAGGALGLVPGVAAGYLGLAIGGAAQPLVGMLVVG